MSINNILQTIHLQIIIVFFNLHIIDISIAMTISLQYIFYYVHMYMSNFIHSICNALIWSLTIMHEPAPSMVTSHSILSEISQQNKTNSSIAQDVNLQVQ